MSKPDAQTADAHPLPDAAASSAEGSGEPVAGTQDELVEADLLVEDVSIDGMCGVY